MKYDIFISYRRKDSSGKSNVPTARQFKLAFEAPPYNYKVFFDYSECTDNYFSDTILPAIRTCDFFVLVLTKDCLLRCSNEGDWVRREIEEAVAYGRKIIPITPDKECESFPTGLPDLLRRTFDGLQITTVYTDHMFEASVDFLVKNRFHLDKVQTESETERKAKEAADRETQEREQKTKQASSIINGHEWVDLGLPSGTLWATCNVGAKIPEEYGDYFAWGETRPKSEYTGNSYRYKKRRLFGNGYSLTKYCTIPNYGYTDRLTLLQAIDDAALVNWGNGWRMPTREQWEELIEYTECTLTTRNGVKGGLFSGTNRNNLFLPSADSRDDEEGLPICDNYGLYWSSSLYLDSPDEAWYFEFWGIICNRHLDHGDRYMGCPIRAVRSSK